MRDFDSPLFVPTWAAIHGFHCTITHTKARLRRWNRGGLGPKLQIFPLPLSNENSHSKLGIVPHVGCGLPQAASFSWRVVLSMDFALEVDWGSKTEQEFQDGSVSVASAVLASPRRSTLRNSLLCRVGRCPVRKCDRPLLPGKRTRFDVADPEKGHVQVWICTACKIGHTRAAQVSAGNKTRRNKVICVAADMLVVCLLLVHLMCMRC